MWRDRLVVPLESVTSPSAPSPNIAVSSFCDAHDGSEMKQSLVPLENETAAPAFELEITAILANVVEADR
jgi:hypothetical protein